MVKCCEDVPASIELEELKKNYSKLIEQYNKVSRENKELEKINKLNSDHIDTFKEQNDTLKKLNKEIDEKNSMLKNRDIQNNSNTQTYTDKLKNNYNKIAVTRVQSIIITFLQQMKESKITSTVK